jgi:hypothetical protein
MNRIRHTIESVLGIKVRSILNFSLSLHTTETKISPKVIGFTKRQRSEVRGQRTEVRGQRSEVRRQQTADGRH